jgi:beta-lactamase class A
MSGGERWRGVEHAAREAERAGGTVGAAVIAPDGDTFAYNGDHSFVAASTVKIPIMVTIFRRVDAGERSLDAPFVLRDEGKTPGSGVLLHLHDGITLTTADLLYLMISISDNTATNILIDMAGMGRVNDTIRSLGMTNSTLGRPMRGRPAQEGEQENWATPIDYTRAVKAILDGTAASPASCQAMTALLEKQQNSRRIARYLPASEDIRWGSKTGTVGRATNDAGFITTGAGTMIIAVFTESLPDAHLAEQAIGDISRAAMQAAGIIAPLPAT